MKSAVFLFLFATRLLFADLDLETLIQDFVLETRRIEIPGFRYAFNPSIIQWKDYILMTFRAIPNPKYSYSCVVGVQILDQDFHPIGEPQILETREKNSLVPPRGEDARLIYVGDTLYLIYSDNLNQEISKDFRMVIAELVYENGLFSIRSPEQLIEYEGKRSNLREKNWVPFEYANSLCLAYSISPHLIFKPILGTGVCTTIARSSTPMPWNWGVIRGGTPAVLIETGEYLAFFHSVKKMATANSNGVLMNHYFIGAYTFASQPPFTLLRKSPEPIVGPGFYSGIAYKPYWSFTQCVFPAGQVLDGDSIWISYGRQDHEIWVAKLDKKKLLDSLIPAVD